MLVPVQIHRFLMQPKLLKFIGFSSTIIALVCFALSTSCDYLIRGWNILKIFIYIIISSFICSIIYSAKIRNHSRNPRIEGSNLAVMFLTLTTVYGFYFDHVVKVKPDAYSVISCAAFAIMSFSLSVSSQTFHGIGVDVLYFFLGSLMGQLMKIKLVLIVIGAGFSYVLDSLLHAMPHGNGVCDEHEFGVEVDSLLQVVTDMNVLQQDAQIGVCYGMMGNNLPPANEVISLYQSNNIKRMRLYYPDKAALEALRNSDIELILGVSNFDLQSLATNAINAHNWVQRNVLNFWPSVKIKYIAVGNEVDPNGETSRIAQFVLPAIVNIYQAIEAQGLHDQIKVSTAIGMTLLGNSYPPSHGSFRGDVRSYIDPIICFLTFQSAPLLANVYPYYGYLFDSNVSLPYSLFTSPDVIWDGQYGYQNLFDAMLDAVHAAIDKTRIGYVEVVVSESGWPSNGNSGASFDNAQVYVNNLICRAKRGSPRRPSKPTEIYVFAMFDENDKDSEVEKHFGLFHPNKEKKYTLNFSEQNLSSY